MSYFNLELNPSLPSGRDRKSLVHALNQRYRGATRFEVKAPDAPGILIVWAESERERDDHIRNALFDMIFDRHRTAAFLDNPACIACGGKTQSAGRNCAGTRVWYCTNDGCHRKFVIDRKFRGGVNHPAQSKKPAFARLLLEGVPVREAADRLGIRPGTACNWAETVAAINRERFADLECPCGKAIRHRGSCAYRRKYSRSAKGGEVSRLENPSRDRS